MVAIFILPPPQFIADNQEIPKQILSQAQNYQKDLLKELNMTSEGSKVTKGSYSGTQVFNWEQKYNAILVTVIIFQKGSGFKNEWMRAATLVRQEDCVHLGTAWNFTENKITPFPIQNSDLKISSFVNRSLSSLSPIKVDINSQFYEKQFHDVFNLVLLEEFSKKNVPIISNIGRYFCKAENLNAAKIEKKDLYPSRPHRLVQIKVTQTLMTAPYKDEVRPAPKIAYNVQMNSGILGQKSRDFIDKKELEEFNPLRISENIVQKIIPTLQNLSQAEFKIVKRIGAWVYLNRGRAYGLTIGMRLVGTNNSKLHIIRYAPELEGEFDASIAFIRHEDAKTPLIIGDILKVDQTLYPR